MTTENQNDLASGEVSQKSSGPEIDKDGKVSHESFMKALDEKKKAQTIIRDYEEKLKIYEQKEKELAEQEMVKRGEFEKILKDREKKIKILEEEKAQIELSRIKSAKLQAFESALGGKIKHPRYYELVDTNKIAIDPTTGAIDMESVKTYANEYVGEFVDTVDFKTSKLPNNAPSQSSSITYEQWLKLPAKEMEERIGEVKI